MKIVNNKLVQWNLFEECPHTMLAEYLVLKNAPYAKEECPKCKQVCPEFMRGQVQRSKRWFWIGPKRPYYAIICHNCKEIIGWEAPEDYTTDMKFKDLLK